ncbi:MAG TPA: AarF/UbiB family protein [Thermoanaerobaculia bacterium]|nr:AarF/UbiB family protein [Thermoanaerobaculia bacterium]
MAAGIDFRRYRKLRRFVTRVFLQVFWWDVVLNVPGLRRFRRSPLPRYQRLARRYRTLAGEMGGVLIKLGQFLSTRVDILPPEITGELAGLQDEVPPERFADIVRQIEADFGRPLHAVFAAFSPEPVGAASLAQVHPATLPSGEEVVVKVLRPGIDVLVETDLAAVRLATRLLRFSKTIRRRVDLGRLGAEITSTTRAELDLEAEGRNAERFAANFAGDDRVYLPKVYWEWSAHRTLTLENVGWLKMGDLEALDRAGIRRAEVARALYRIYLKQIFEHRFVHADPHPGNLFVRPLPIGDELPVAPGVAPPSPPAGEERPFQIVFVDFGMVAVIPDRLRGALREYVIGLGTRDAARLVHSYVAAGVLLPGADLRRLEEVHEELFARFWGVSVGNLQATAFSEAEFFFREYRDLLYELPFQVQVDLLFTSRAVGLLAGLSTQLDPEFDPWAETIPFAERLAAEELRRDWRGLLREGATQIQTLLALPRRLDAVLSRAERGTLVVQSALSPEDRKMVRRLERAIHRLSWTLLAAGLVVAGVKVHDDAPGTPWGWLLMALGALAFLWGALTKT